jgi:hypothetical protein
VPTAKAAAHKTEDLWKATEHTVEQVKENVVTKPYNMAAEAARRNKEYVEQTTRTTVDSLLTQADQVVDKLLPEVDSPMSSPKSSGSNATVDPVQLTKKLSTRLYGRASEIYTHSAERASEIVHIDLIAYAKETVGADETKLAKAFDRVMDLLPSPETTQKATANLIDRLPKAFQPTATVGANFVQPVVNKSIAAISAFILFVRSFIVPSQAEATPVADSLSDSGVLVQSSEVVKGAASELKDATESVAEATKPSVDAAKTAATEAASSVAEATKPSAEVAKTAAKKATQAASTVVTEAKAASTPVSPAHKGKKGKKVATKDESVLA